MGLDAYIWAVKDDKPQVPLVVLRKSSAYPVIESVTGESMAHFYETHPSGIGSFEITEDIVNAWNSDLNSDNDSLRDLVPLGWNEVWQLQRTLENGYEIKLYADW